MSEMGGDILGPGEGSSGAPEQLSEEAKQRFAASAAAMKALQREEKKSKKRDSRVVQTIIKFLNDDRYSHLFLLISRLVARDCPSVFILAILSLIDEESRSVVTEYLQEGGRELPALEGPSVSIVKGGNLDAHTNEEMIQWVTRMQLVLSMEAKEILRRLIVDGDNVDGTVLQLATFVLQEFFTQKLPSKEELPFEQLHPLTAGILQSVLEPFMDEIDMHSLPQAEEDND
jgi:hypothetical protein